MRDSMIERLSERIHRWRATRGVILSSILLAGGVLTATTVIQKMHAHRATCPYQTNYVYSYAGVGIAIEYDRNHNLVVRQVFPNSPAFGHIRNGAMLMAVGTRNCA